MKRFFNCLILFGLVVSVGCWSRYRKIARSAPALLVRGRVQKQGSVVNIVADKFEPLPVGSAPKLQHGPTPWATDAAPGTDPSQSMDPPQSTDPTQSTARLESMARNFR